jgi:hypothetical protein
MGVSPEPWEVRRFAADEPQLWSYLVVSNEEEPCFDFVNVFLDLLEPRFEALQKLGIEKDDISFQLTYLYKLQCSLGFNAQEMLRLGASGIGLAIDCFEERDISKTP